MAAQRRTKPDRQASSAAGQGRLAGHNVPVALTSFIGRSTEMNDLERLIAERRLVTLTGVGGCGKTRLAVELGTRIVERQRDGVWIVDLGSVNDPDQVPTVTAATMGILVDPAIDPVEALVAGLRDRAMLLCLDTCEHLLDAAANVAGAILRGCPDLTVLATSREPLGVLGEAVWRVPSLQPDEAIQLFTDRAALVAPHFDPDSSADDVAALCARLDHIPLAIELAAAWVRALSPAQILDGLSGDLRLLEGGPRGTVPRHQTLLASMRWSHALLAEEEQVFFRRLAVFSGTFTLDAAESIAAADLAGPDTENSRLTTLGLIGRLLDSSLVTVRETEQGEMRYRLLDTIRQYGEELLREANETESTRNRHLQYFLELAEQAQTGLDEDQDTWRTTLESHRANINAALQWGLSPPADRADRGRRLAAAMARQWMLRGQAAEGLDFLRRAIDLAPDERSVVAGRLLAGNAMLGMVSGRATLLDESVARGLEIADEVGDEITRGRCLAMSAYPVFFTDFARCQSVAAEARAVGEAAGDPFTRDWATVIEGYSTQTRNRHDEARALARLAFDRSQPRGDRFCAAFARAIEIYTEFVCGRVSEAVAIADEVVRTVGPLGDYFAVGTNTVNAAHARVIAGELTEARAMMEPVVRSVDSAPEADVVGFMVPYGLLHLWEGDLDAAIVWFERGVQRMSETAPDWTAARCLPGLVGALRRAGRTEEALQWATRAISIEAGFGGIYELTDVIDEQARLLHATDPLRARQLHLDALAMRRDIGLRLGYVDSLDALASLDIAADKPADAAGLLAISDVAREDMGYPRRPVDIPEYDEMVAALRSALPGDAFERAWSDGASRGIDETVAALTRGRGTRDRPSSGWESLTPTERDVVRLICEGLSNPQIAERLYVSRSTVKAHLSHIYAKLGVGNRTELAIAAAAHLT
jgi:predicted ATPase/DNA-binding CsgD family transcriptional regulator